MKRALSFCFALLIIALAQPAMAADRPSGRPTCVHVPSIHDWRVRAPRKVFVVVGKADTWGLFIVTFVNECFPRFPKNTLRVEARSECLAPGDSMFFTFPPSKSSSSDTEVRCVVQMVQGTSPSRPDDPPTCTWVPSPDGRGPMTEDCH